MEKNSKIFIAGHRGLVGAAIVSALQNEGFSNLVLKTHAELDLTNQQAVADFFAQEKPEYVFLAAAKVGGIMANKNYPADFIYNNLTIETNVIHNAYVNKVKKLLFLGSSCIYPRMCQQPIKEEYLLTSELEPTNKAYALAKIAGIIMCQSYNEQHGTNFISLMPTNLYGPHDNFDLDNSHVMPAMIRKFHEAKISNAPQISMWGTGVAMREFLHVDDLANASIFLMNNYDDSSIVNVGTGEDVTIKELAEKIKEIVGYEGEIVWDSTKPDGTPRKLLDVTKLHATGWKHTIPLNEGISSTYAWFKENYK
ncbi:MAG: GDP-L-fucose synthase [Candidatus Paceibacterota bacterium]|jgi:GDP-L-fucose synthase